MEKYTTGGIVEANLVFPNSILIPTNDDKPANAETVRSAYKALSDRTRQIHNFMAWQRSPSEVFCENGTDLIIDSLGPAPIYDAVFDQWFLFRGPLPDNQIVYTPAGLVAETWYYLYITQTAGVLTLGYDTTPPDLLLTSKAGDVITRYVTCFRTGGAGILPFRCVNGQFTYDSQHQIGGFISPTDFADPVSVIDCRSRVPPHIRVADLIAQGNNFAAANTLDFMTIRRNGATQNTYIFGFSSNSFNSNMTIRQTLDGNQKFQSIITINTNTEGFFIIGWQER